MRLKRVDAATPDELVAKEEPKASLLSEDEMSKVKDIFTEAAPVGNYTVEVKAMGSDDLPLLLTQEEFMRRFSEMSRMGGGMAGFGGDEEHFTAVVNASHPIMATLLSLPVEKQSQAVAHFWDLALLAQGRLKGESLSKFVYRSAASLPQEAQ
jgi:molecular chaperone HtpG